MRALFAAATLAALALAGCSPPSPPAPPASADQTSTVQPVPADAIAVRGEITIPGQKELPNNLDLRLRLLDMSNPDVPPPVVAERIEPAPRMLPYSYALPYEASKIQTDRTYVIEASLQAGGTMLYGTPVPSSVLTQGAGKQANLELSRGAFSAADTAPADLLKQAFEALEASIGGMQRLTGERINDAVTIGWDGFADGDDVRFARENVDYGDAGSASLRYGYRNGEPWVIAREQRGVLSMVGWSDQGQLLLNRHGDGEQLDETAVADLRTQAERLYASVKSRVGSE